MELTPISEVQARVEKMQARMREATLDAVFVLQNVDLFYFTGTAQSGLLCLPAEGEPVYLVQKSLPRARMESPLNRILEFPGFKKLPESLQAEGIHELRRIGIEGDVLPANYYLRLKACFPGAELLDASDAIRRIRMVKSDAEIGMIRRAAGMLREAFDGLSSWIRAGASELEVMAQLEGFLRTLGHQGIIRMRGFNCQVGFGVLSGGANAVYPSPFPGPIGSSGLYPAIPVGAGDHILAEGETLMADIVAGYGGYIADKTRTYSVGSIPRDFAAAHRFILELNREIETMLKPGVPCSSIYRRALEMVKEAGYEEGFMGIGKDQMRFIGHGVGLELDELPAIASGSDVVLEPGMTIAVEPKVFFRRRGGAGIENTYAITATGFEKLTEYPEEIREVSR
jgi:Xaa-Pro aminopeptidase